MDHCIFKTTTFHINAIKCTLVTFMEICKCIMHSYFRRYITTQGGTGELWGYGGLSLLPRKSVTQMSSAFFTVPLPFF